MKPFIAKTAIVLLEMNSWFAFIVHLINFQGTNVVMTQGYERGETQWTLIMIHENNLTIIQPRDVFPNLEDKQWGLNALHSFMGKAR